MSDLASPQAPAAIDPEKTRKKLTFFKVMAMIVGIGLLVLVAEMILRYRFENHALDWWPQPHGFIFVIYVIATAMLSFEVRWPIGKMALIMLAGCVPFLSFWVERKVSGEVESLLRDA